jgi:predicted DNA-binding transcriptional regulator AlpA
MTNGFAQPADCVSDVHSTDRHLTIADLAEREQVPPDTVRKWNATRTGPSYMRIGRYVRYRLADVLSWEASRTVKAGSGETP